MFFCKYCKIFKITCFEKHLRTATSVRCQFDTINLKQSGFCTPYSCKILVSEPKYKNNLKNGKSQNKQANKQTKNYNSHISVKCLCNVLLQNPVGLSGLSENLCFLNLYVRHAVRILDLSLEIMLTTPK